MKKFEYKTFIVDTKCEKGFDINTLKDWLNKLGDEGWELISMTTNYEGAEHFKGLFLVLKREK